MMDVSHLLGENLGEDVVRDVLTAPAPCHPLAHTWVAKKINRTRVFKTKLKRLDRLITDY